MKDGTMDKLISQHIDKKPQAWICELCGAGMMFGKPRRADMVQHLLDKHTQLVKDAISKPVSL